MKVVEHEVLKTLRSCALTVSQTGSEAGGFMPLDKFQLGTAECHYGTLVDLMNNPDKYFGIKGRMIVFREVKMKRHEVVIGKYKWAEVQKALEILEHNGDIKEHNRGSGLDLTERSIMLTEKGQIALNTDYYIKQRIDDRYKANLPYYTGATVFFTALAAAGAISGAFFSYQQLHKPNSPVIIPELAPLIQEWQTQHKDTLKVKTVIVPLRKH